MRPRLGSGAPADIIQNFRDVLNEILKAYNEERGRKRTRTAECDRQPRHCRLRPIAYAKPVLVLVDEFSTASAETCSPPSCRTITEGPLLGMRTMGAGGSVVHSTAPHSPKVCCTVTVSLMNRGTVISGTDYPPSPYIENVGVRPDIVVDYMTRANLMSGGAPFVEAFTQAAVKLAQANALPH